jgi:NAD-dependent SIR2 family protein deacetylase
MAIVAVWHIGRESVQGPGLSSGRIRFGNQAIHQNIIGLCQEDPLATTYNLERELDRAAEMLASADSLLVLAGAGMGVDSGLPDYRGDAGLWANHAAFRHARISYDQASSGKTVFHDPTLAWGIYGHKLRMYRQATPHTGFRVLLDWAYAFPRFFVVTSNIDGQFQKAGFPEKFIHECHGSIHHLQCSQGCTQTIWSARNVEPDIDEQTLRWRGEMPRCVYCGQLARPNILMFHDAHWVTMKDQQQAENFKRWRAEVERPVCIEIGAGTDVMRIRNLSEAFSHRLIRINPGNCEVRSREVGLRLGAAEALRRLAGRVVRSDESG